MQFTYFACLIFIFLLQGIRMVNRVSYELFYKKKFSSYQLEVLSCYLICIFAELMAKLKRAKGDEGDKEGGNDGDSSEDSP